MRGREWRIEREGENGRVGAEEGVGMRGEKGREREREREKRESGRSGYGYGLRQGRQTDRQTDRQTKTDKVREGRK